MVICSTQKRLYGFNIVFNWFLGKRNWTFVDFLSEWKIYDRKRMCNQYFPKKIPFIERANETLSIRQILLMKIFETIFLPMRVLSLKKVFRKYSQLICIIRMKLFHLNVDVNRKSRPADEH